MGSLGGIPVDVGDILAKKFRIERLVGEGVTGVVVAAEHLQLERVVAIKFLRTALASDEIRLRFEREARAIGTIESEHVVLVFDVGATEDGAPFMVMEFLDGRDLAKILKEDGPLPVPDAVDCMLQVCQALAQAHDCGIIHRDLKPANLFLTRRDDGAPHIKVVDFGISKILDPKLLSGGPREVTSAFTVLGSPRYMAPEQLRNSKDVDSRADLWSVGAVLFQLVTGKYAFDAESNVHASLAVLTKEPVLLREYAPSAPAALEAIINKCLTKDPNERYQTARELAEALYPLASERTRESIDRLAAADEAPDHEIPLAVSSVIPGGSGSQPPPRVEIPRAAPVPAAPGSAPSVRSSASASVPIVLPVPPPTPSTRDLAIEAAKRAPNTTLKVALAAGGFLVVLLAFGLLTVAKKAAESAGVIRPPSADPPAAYVPAPPPSGAEQGPSKRVTVALDAGAAP